MLKCPTKSNYIWKHTFFSLKNKPTLKQMLCGWCSVFFPNAARERTKKWKVVTNFCIPKENKLTKLFCVF